MKKILSLSLFLVGMFFCGNPVSYAAGTTPESFTFMDVTGANISTDYISNPISVSDLDSATTISISGDGTYRINSGSWVSTAGTVDDNDLVEVKLTSSNSYSSVVSTTLTIGGVTDNFDVSTKSAISVAPTLTEITPVDTPTDDATPSYTFHTTGTGAVAYGGGCTSGDTAAAVGYNTITFSTLSDATYDNCSLTLTDGVGNVTAPLNVSDFVVDTTDPLLSNGAPTGTLTAGTTATTLSVDTNENATCRYATTSGVAYGSMTNLLSGGGATSHQSVLTGLTAGQNYNYYMVCLDTAGNESNEYHVSFAVSDGTSPVISNGSPTGTLNAGTTSTTLSVQTNENATCRYSTTSGVDFDNMTQALGEAGTTSHSVTLSGLSDGASYMYYVRCEDPDGNENPADYQISFSVADPATDEQAPVRSNGAPTGLLSSATTNTQISLNTNENAICRYATSPGVSYGSMANLLSGGGTTSHSGTVSVSAGNSYNFYVRCMDNYGNYNLDDYQISFTVADEALVADFHSNVNNGEGPLTVQFTDDSVGSITSWAWDFDNDGTTDSTQQNPSHTYSLPGTYTVELTVSNGSNSDAEVKYNYIVVNDPSSTNSYLQVIKNGTGFGTVSTSSTGISCGIDCYESYADGTDVVLTATSGAGSTFDSWTVTTNAGTNTYSGTSLALSLDDNTTVVATFNLVTTLTADFTSTDTSGQAFFGTHFIDASTGNPTTWQWDFDNDGIVDSTDQNPYYVYTSAGTYAVRLVVTNGSNTDQEIKTNYITVTENSNIIPTTTNTVTTQRYTGMGGGQNDQRHGEYDANDLNAGFFGAPYINPVNVKASIIKVPTLCGVPESNYVTHNLYNLIRRTTGLPVQCASELTLVPQSLQLGQRDICNE